MKKIRAILVDDELDSLRAVQEQIKLYCPEVAIAGVFDDSLKGFKAIEALKPDVVFLDIQMPGMSGLEIAGSLINMDCSIIFVTAYDHYAIDAIKLSALDYLLKPIDPDELVLAVNKVQERVELKRAVDTKRIPVLKKLLLDNQLQSFSQDTIIGLPDEKGISYIKIKDIIRLEASRNYCNFYLLDGSAILVSKNIGAFIEGLKHYGLTQVHRAHVVNRNHIKRYVKLYGPYLKMCDGSEVPVSKSFKDNI